MESIEVVVRQSLNTTAVKQNTPDANVKAEILETTLKCDSILQQWDTISQSIPAKYEQYSMDLLKAVVDLWINTSTAREECWLRFKYNSTDVHLFKATQL